jgi:hypothetical protein
MLKHGIRREVFVSWLADNADEILRTGDGTPQVQSLQSVSEIAALAIERWIIPRAVNKPEYLSWSRDDLLNLFGHQTRAMRSAVKKVG